jgi:hypothetical protein
MCRSAARIKRTEIVFYVLIRAADLTGDGSGQLQRAGAAALHRAHRSRADTALWGSINEVSSSYEGGKARGTQRGDP